MDSAAMRLSRIAMTARPVREFIRFRIIMSDRITRMIPMVNVESLGVPVMPWGPFMITFPSASSPRDMESFMEK